MNPVMNKRWRTHVARTGHLVMVDAGPTKRHLRRLKKAGWTQAKIAAEVGCTQQQISYILRKAKQVDYRQAGAIEALWRDVCPPVEKDRRRWPIEPFKAAALAQKGSVRALGNSNMRRMIHAGGTISTKQAENYADSLGLLPVEIWTDWYEA